MGQTGRDGRDADPLTILTQGMRKMSALRIDDITRGLQNFANPSARGLLESLGRTRQEQVDTMASMLRNSSEADIDEMGQVFALAMAKLAEERSNATTPGATEPERPRRRRHQTAAERRRQRYLAV
jgi:hypothetical protein